MGNETPGMKGGIDIIENANQLLFVVKENNFPLLGLNNIPFEEEDPAFLSMVSNQLLGHDIVGLWESNGKQKQYFSHLVQTKGPQGQITIALVKLIDGEPKLMARAAMRDMKVTDRLLSFYDLEKTDFVNKHRSDFDSREYLSFQPYIESQHDEEFYLMYLLLFALFDAKKNFEFVYIDNTDHSSRELLLKVLKRISPEEAIYKLNATKLGKTDDYAYILDPFDL